MSADFNARYCLRQLPAQESSTVGAHSAPQRFVAAGLHTRECFGTTYLCRESYPCLRVLRRCLRLNGQQPEQGRGAQTTRTAAEAEAASRCQTGNEKRQQAHRTHVGRRVRMCEAVRSGAALVAA
jgi:hypothetical protein